MARHRELADVLAGVQRMLVTSARQTNETSRTLSDSIRAVRAYAPGGDGPHPDDSLTPVLRRFSAVSKETQAELESALEHFEDALASVGDDAQLANLDLQHLLQKQQQTLQALSNVTKALQDTALAVIRKIGG